jgi:threonine dehydrogenase-like Zn-dependent dehydrogenase
MSVIAAAYGIVITMKAFVLTAPRVARVEDVEAPVAGYGEVVVDVERVGVCGTDVEFFTGEMDYLHQGHASYPIRLGHEWCGTVHAIGPDVDSSWLGRRVTGDTMLGCGVCHRCLTGRQHVCEFRAEIGIRKGWPGALAEQLPVPVTALYPLPDAVGVVAGALVEPASNAVRAVAAASLHAGSRVAIFGPGTLGLLACQFAAALGAEVHLVGNSVASLEFARSLGFERSWLSADLPALPYDAVIDATPAADVPRRVAELVEPGGRVVYIGIAGEPSMIDTRTLVFNDVTAVGILSGSGGQRAAIDQIARGLIDPTPLVAATVGLDQVADVLAGWRPIVAPGAGPLGPKIHVDPRR